MYLPVRASWEMGISSTIHCRDSCVRLFLQILGSGNRDDPALVTAGAVEVIDHAVVKDHPGLVGVFVGKGHRPAEPEIRRPKVEGRKKAEIRNPKSAGGAKFFRGRRFLSSSPFNRRDAKSAEKETFPSIFSPLFASLRLSSPPEISPQLANNLDYSSTEGSTRCGPVHLVQVTMSYEQAKVSKALGFHPAP